MYGLIGADGYFMRTFTMSSKRTEQAFIDSCV